MSAEALHAASDSGSDEILSVRGLTVAFAGSEGAEHVAVKDFSLTIGAGEFVGVMGEPGCGKSTAAIAMMGLVRPPGRIVSGEVHYLGRDLLAMSDAELDAIRGRDIGLIVQSPRTSLHPMLTVGPADRERLPRAQPREPQGSPRQGHRDAAACRHQRPRAAGEVLSPRAFHGHDPARADRHGHELRAQAPDRGRADKRPRRHDPGAVPRPDVGDGEPHRVRRAGGDARPRHRRQLLRPRGHHGARRDRRGQRRAGLLRRTGARLQPAHSLPAAGKRGQRGGRGRGGARRRRAAGLGGGPRQGLRHSRVQGQGPCGRRCLVCGAPRRGDRPRR